MTDFSTLDNTLNFSSHQPSLLLRNYQRPTFNHSKLSPIYHSLSPKAKRDLAYPPSSGLKDFLSSFQEQKTTEIKKIPKKLIKIPKLHKENPIYREIFDISKQETRKKGLKSNVLCLFNHDLKRYLELKATNSTFLKDFIVQKNEAFFLNSQINSYRNLSQIYESVLIKEKDIIVHDLMKTIKQEIDCIFQDFQSFLTNFQQIKEQKQQKTTDFCDKTINFEGFIEVLLQFFDLELNEKELFGILRPEKQELQEILSKYKRFSGDLSQKIELGTRLERKLSTDFELILKQKADNSLLLKENQELCQLKEKFQKDSTETFLMVKERLNILEKRNLALFLKEKPDSQQKTQEKPDSQQKSIEINQNYLNNGKNAEENIRKLIEINESLSNDNLGLKQHKEVLLKKVARLTMQIKKLNIKKDIICLNKETDVRFFSENPFKKPIKSLRYILNNPSLISTNHNYSYKWTLILMNLIYSHKIIHDIINEYENISPKSLKELMLDFFVTRFKSKYLIETLMKDFINNLKKYAPFSLRIKLFCQLSGLILEPPTQHFLDLSNEEVFPYNSIKTTIFTQNSVCEVFLSVIYNIRLSLTNSNTLNNSIKNADGFCDNVASLNKSFLSFEEDEALGLETAKNLIQQIIAQEGHSENIPRDYEEGFQNILESDLYERITNYNEEIIGNSHRSLLQNVEVIRMDFFIKFLMDLLMEKKIAEFQQIHTLLKLQKLNKNELFFNLKDFKNIITEVFSGNKYFNFVENCFLELIDEFNEENRFNSTLKNLVSVVSEFQKPKNSYFFTKVMSSTNKTFKGSNELKDYCKGVFGDWMSELGIIVETYKIFKHVLFRESRNNQKINALHEELLKEIYKIDKNIMTAKSYEANWMGGDKSGFLKGIEELWGKLLELLENILKENLS